MFTEWQAVRERGSLRERVLSLTKGTIVVIRWASIAPIYNFHHRGQDHVISPQYYDKKWAEYIITG